MHSRGFYVAAFGGAIDVLRSLPVLALHIRPEPAATLRRLGIETIGELESLPRAPLAKRFGPDVLLRLDQTFGRQREPIGPIDIPELPKVRRRHLPQSTKVPGVSIWFSGGSTRPCEPARRHGRPLA
jgi:hypothetical protein